jgi:hypothetical protein
MTNVGHQLLYIKSIILIITEKKKDNGWYRLNTKKIIFFFFQTLIYYLKPTFKVYSIENFTRYKTIYIFYIKIIIRTNKKL